MVEDQHRFIVHHRLMEKVTDDCVAVSIVRETKERFPCVQALSSEQDRQRETSPEFVVLRHKHSAVESAIHALEVHGLDQCPDHGIMGFKRYVALAVLARNIQRLGAVVRGKNQLAEKRRGRSSKEAA